MQYLVNASGEVLSKQAKAKAYAIKAHSKEEALEIAKNNFIDDYYTIDETISVIPYRRTRNAVVSYFFMLIPILLSFVRWYLPTGHNPISIMPDFISNFFAVLLYAAFLVRFKGIQRTIGSWIDIVLCVFSVLLTSSFIRIILVIKPITIFGKKEISIDTSWILLVAIVLSWLGLKIMSVVCIVGVGAFAFFNIAQLSEAMGPVWGTVYILCSFMGILFYISIEPAFIEALPYLKKSGRNGLNYLRDDMVKAGNSAICISGEALNKIGKK